MVSKRVNERCIRVRDFVATYKQFQNVSITEDGLVVVLLYNKINSKVFHTFLGKLRKKARNASVDIGIDDKVEPPMTYIKIYCNY